MNDSKRIEENYKKIAILLSELSTCARVQVGALLVKEGRIVCTGWNGVPSGERHCNEIFKEDLEKYNESLDYITKHPEAIVDSNNIHMKTYESFREKHHKFAVENELHSEQNLIAYCAKEGISMEGATLYITVSPCSQCAKLLVSARIKEVKYINKYDGDSGLDFLIRNGINCIQI